MNAQPVHVAVAAIVNENDEVLISKRHDDVHQGGLWEFPGGKLEPKENVEQALIRECQEELGITPTEYHPLIKITHHYTDRSVCLDVFKILAYTGTASGLEGQPIKWQSISTLLAEDFPAADEPIINTLRLPDRYLITGKFDSLEDFDTRLENALKSGIRLVQLRLKQQWLDKNRAVVDDICKRASTLCQQYDSLLLLNIPQNINPGIEYDGIHADSRMLNALTARPECRWFSASCHSLSELKKAERLKADFAVLSPVQYTRSHPDTEPLGWDSFAELVQQVNIPVYALGGVSGNDISQSRSVYAQGVAAIRAFWSV